MWSGAATKTIKPGRAVVIWRVDVIFLDKSDWKYEGSKGGASGGGRAHTFGVQNPAEKLKDAAAYANRNVILKGGKPIMTEAEHFKSAPPNKL